MKYSVFCTLIVLCIASCTTSAPVNPEEQAQIMLSEARQLLLSGNCEAARDTIISMRKTWPTALDARRQAILTLDSVELAIALQEGDSLKIEFFQRKIEHDQEQLCAK